MKVKIAVVFISGLLGFGCLIFGTQTSCDAETSKKEPQTRPTEMMVYEFQEMQGPSFLMDEKERNYRTIDLGEIGTNKREIKRLQNLSRQPIEVYASYEGMFVLEERILNFYVGNQNYTIECSLHSSDKKHHREVIQILAKMKVGDVLSLRGYLTQKATLFASKTDFSFNVTEIKTDTEWKKLY